MPAIIVNGDKTQGHGWPSVGLRSSKALNSGVHINSTKVIVVGDKSSVFGRHGGCGPGGCDPSPDHAVVVSEGSPTVFIGAGLAVCRDMDSMGCGDVAKASPDANVFAD